MNQTYFSFPSSNVPQSTQSTHSTLPLLMWSYLAAVRQTTFREGEAHQLVGKHRPYARGLGTFSQRQRREGAEAAKMNISSKLHAVFRLIPILLEEKMTQIGSGVASKMDTPRNNHLGLSNSNVINV